jgi:hypothetical protein
MKKRKKPINKVDFSFDSLADIVSNVLGILVLLGVMIGTSIKTDEHEKVKEEREKILGKQDAMSDILFKDNRLAIPLLREARYNRFHVHVIAWQDKLFFVDLAEFNYIYNKEGGGASFASKIVGDCKIELQFRDLTLRDSIWFVPVEEKGLILKNKDMFNNEKLRSFFRLVKSVDEKNTRYLTNLAPNNHAVHFHVFPSGVKAFNLGNEYLRMLGFDTGWELIPEVTSGKVLLPVNLQEQTKIRNKNYIQ